MKAKSLSVFRTKLSLTDTATTLVTIGQIIEGDEEHLRALARNRLVELLDDDAPAARPAKPAPGTTPAPAKTAKPGAAARPAKKAAGKA